MQLDEATILGEVEEPPQCLEKRQRVHRQVRPLDEPIAAASIRPFAPPLPFVAESVVAGVRLLALLRVSRCPRHEAV